MEMSKSKWIFIAAALCGCTAVSAACAEQLLPALGTAQSSTAATLLCGFAALIKARRAVG
jgi:hypothetical protein